MASFEWILALLCGALTMSGIARRLRIPWPTLLAVGGAALALVPKAPRLELDPSLALALFVAPVLVDSAFDASQRDLRRNWASLSGLIVVAVTLTAFGVALVARRLRPDLPFAVALVLGAIVAPPDAAAASTVLRSVKLPHRILTILEGESLLNDASALLLYRVAIGAATTAGFSYARELPLAGLSIVASIIAGVVSARLWGRLVLEKLDYAPSSIIVQFIGTFGTWIFAEKVGLSGVLTLVAFAFTASRRNAMPARLRVPSFAVWETAVFMLNVFAFVIIGLQLRPILEALSPEERTQDLLFAGAILVTVIVCRFAWVMFYNACVRWYLHGRKTDNPLLVPTVRGGLLISWCGMRGVVTLATALALPADFPRRGLLMLTAFVVTLGTLLFQGLTLRGVIRWFDLKDDSPVEREVGEAWRKALEAARATLDGEDSEAADVLRREYDAAIRATENDEPTRPALPGDALRLKAVNAARDTVHELRETGAIGNDAFNLLQEELDRLELSAAET